MATNRSKRLQKKLHLNEFTELGFQVLFTPTGRSDIEVLADLSEVSMPRAIAFLYEQPGVVFLSKNSGGSLTDEDRAGVASWFKTRTDIESFDVKPLVDAWHPPRAAKSFYAA
jgi:hypothetical protein